MRGLSRRALGAHTTLFGMWIAGYWPVSDFGLVLKAWLCILAEFLGSFYAAHVRFDLFHLRALHRASTDALVVNCFMFILLSLNLMSQPIFVLNS